MASTSSWRAPMRIETETRVVGPYQAMLEADAGTGVVVGAATMGGVPGVNAAAVAARGGAGGDAPESTGGAGLAPSFPRRLADVESLLADEQRNSASLREENVRLLSKLRAVEANRDAAALRPLSIAKESEARAAKFAAKLKALEAELAKERQRNESLVKENEDLSERLRGETSEREASGRDKACAEEALSAARVDLRQAAAQRDKAIAELDASRRRMHGAGQNASISGRDEDGQASDVDSEVPTASGAEKGLGTRATNQVERGLPSVMAREQPDQQLYLAGPAAVRRLHGNGPSIDRLKDAPTEREQGTDAATTISSLRYEMESASWCESHLPPQLKSSYLLDGASRVSSWT